MEIKIKRLNDLAVLPAPATVGAGGMDLTATEIEKVADDFVIVKFGFSCEFDDKLKLTLVPRSSLTGTHWIIQNSPGLGDSDYRGEYQLRFRALPTGYDARTNKLTYPKFPYKVGERVGQCYIEQVIPVEWKDTTILTETARGEGGHGSTNEKEVTE